MLDKACYSFNPKHQEHPAQTSYCFLLLRTSQSSISVPREAAQPILRNPNISVLPGLSVLFMFFIGQVRRGKSDFPDSRGSALRDTANIILKF